MCLKETKMTIIMGNKIIKRQKNNLTQINNTKPQSQNLILPNKLSIAPSYIIWSR